MDRQINDIIIIDHFLPEDFRQKLLAPDRKMSRMENVYYAGETGFISKDERDQLEEIFKAKLPVQFRDFQCRLRRTRPENQKKAESFIHTDHFAEYSAIIYLNDGAGANGEPTGTYFWESTITKSKEMRSEKMEKMYRDIMLVNQMTFELDKWSIWKKIDQKANRCIVFPSLFFHSPPLMDIDMGERTTLDVFLNIRFEFQYKKRES